MICRKGARALLIHLVNQINTFELASMPFFCQDDFIYRLYFYKIKVLIAILVVKRFG
jgi:hypothetical protein